MTALGFKLKLAVLNVEPYKIFFETYSGKKVPTAGPLKEFLTTQAGVDESRRDEVIDYLHQDGDTAGSFTDMKGAKWIDLSGIPAPPAADDEEPADDGDGADPDELENESVEKIDNDPPPPQSPPPPDTRPSAIFLGHGKNRKPLEQLIKILDEYGIPHKEAMAEANAGRPIPTKVAETMRDCGAAILIFTGDAEFFDADRNSIWKPSENVVHELGASSVLYDNRIIIFKEEGVNLASNFSSIGYISFEKDKLSDKGIELFRELVKFKIVKVTVGG